MVRFTDPRQGVGRPRAHVDHVATRPCLGRLAAISSGLSRPLAARSQDVTSFLTDDDVDRVQGKAEQLVGRIQERYGIARDEAQRQVDTWAPPRSPQL